jgi:tRNA pseudouridine38-40 synthase
VGEHDFASFQNTTKTPPAHTVRRVFALEIVEQSPLVCVRIAGSSFLYNMVRNIAGTLLEVGCGLREARSMSAILEARDRKAAGLKAEAKGLCLLGVYFDRPSLDRCWNVRDFLAPFFAG